MAFRSHIAEFCSVTALVGESYTRWVKPETRGEHMAKSLRKQIEELEAENEELRDTLDDYEDRFDKIAEVVPEQEEEGEGE